MNLPLHKDAQKFNNVENCPENAHAGLWYDRFFNCYDAKWEVLADDEKAKSKVRGKKAWCNSVGKVGDDGQLKDLSERQQALCKALDGKSVVMATDWHFVTGMGNNHPVENGFAWHPTLGVPYLTGAAVKGMVKAWCESWKGWKPTKQEREENPALENDPRLKEWFGDADQSGELIFFDAVPTAPVKLKADIMTPHYRDWYAKGAEPPKKDGTNVPADWHDPNPIPFLVVDKGATFQFSFTKRMNSDIELGDVRKALTQALEWIGAGAKTAAGYGRFITEEEKQAPRTGKQELATNEQLQALMAKHARDRK